MMYLEVFTDRERSLSKVKPRLHVESLEVSKVLEKVSVVHVTVSFERFCGVPMIKNSVIKGLTERRFEFSQA